MLGVNKFDDALMLVLLCLSTAVAGDSVAAGVSQVFSPWLESISRRSLDLNGVAAVERGGMGRSAV